MIPECRGYILREYGSWSVLTVCYIAGLAVSQSLPMQSLPLFVALALLVNSKQAYTAWVRPAGGRRYLVVFLVQVVLSASIMLVLFGGTILQVLPLLIFPAAYFASQRLVGEHAVLTEFLGFCLLSLAAVLAKYLVVQGVDIRLLVAVALYFGAGVFKIKSLLLRKARYRVLMLAYALAAAYVYRRFYISLLVLIPIVENVIAALILYKVRLRTTGWIEVGKSLVFLALLTLYF